MYLVIYQLQFDINFQINLVLNQLTPVNKLTLSTVIVFVLMLYLIGQVEYDMIGFLDKNRDTLSPTVASLMRCKLL